MVTLADLTITILPFLIEIHTTMKKISIAMATYNGAPYVAEQLKSFAAQTVLPDELVVTDDNSTDATLAIIADFAATSPFPIRIEKNDAQLGYRGNFMKAASLCHGDLIAFSDQDDVWMPRKLEQCLAAFEDEDVLLTYHNVTVVDGALQPIGGIQGRNPPQAINRAQSLDPWLHGLGFTLVFSRYLMSFDALWPGSSDFLPVHQREAHDQWYFFLASSLGTIVYIDQPLALYRQHGKNSYGWKKNPLWKKIWTEFSSTSIAEIKSHEVCAGYRAYMFEQIQNEMSDVRKSRAAAAAAGYRKLESRYRKRRQIYAATNVFSRFGKMITLLQSGGYGPKNQWCPSWKNMAKDLVRGVLVPLHVPFGD